MFNLLASCQVGTALEALPQIRIFLRWPHLLGRFYPPMLGLHRDSCCRGIHWDRSVASYIPVLQVTLESERLVKSKIVGGRPGCVRLVNSGDNDPLTYTVDFPDDTAQITVRTSSSTSQDRNSISCHLI